MKTYPNQKVIHINKNKYSANFLQIGINEWQQAYKELKPSTFAIYLYLASNADGFDLALSQQAIENSLGIKKTAYHTAIKELKERGYIQVIQGNVEVFFTAPVRKNELKTEEAIFRKNELKSSQTRKEEFAKTNSEVRKNDIEIDNINNIDIIDKEFLPTEEILDGFAIEPVKQESINQNNEAEGTISECGAQFQNVSSAQSEIVYNIKEINNNNKKGIDIGDFAPVRKNQKPTQKPKTQPKNQKPNPKTKNLNDNVNVNDNDNENDNVNGNSTANRTAPQNRKNELKSSQMRNTNSAKTNSEVRKNGREIDNINNINNIDIGDFVASQQNPATSLASQVSSVEQVEAVGADKVISVACSDMRDSYYHLYKYLAKYQPTLASFVVNGVAFCRNNKERTDKAIEICNTYGYTIEFNDTAAAVANA